MKQAVLIIAYEKIYHLRDLIQVFSNDFRFYIHLDKKVKIKDDELRELKADSRVVLISRKYTVNWGSINLTKAILHLAREAAKSPEIDYVHLVSGADFPIMNSDDILHAFANDNRKEFLEAFRLSTCTWENQGLDRLVYYHFTNLLNVKNPLQKVIYKVFLALQRQLGIKRKIAGLPELHGGSTWWSLSADCIKYVLQFIERNPSFLKRFKHTLIADEIVFQTIIMNSPFKSQVEGHNNRLIIWKEMDSTHPEVLDETNFQEILHSKKIFARKFDYPKSKILIDLLKNTLQAPSTNYH